jgi:hypothetical protein
VEAPPYFESPTSLDRDELRRLLRQQYAWHEVPHWPQAHEGGEVVTPRVHALTDIYKCLHQGEFGVGHLISSPDLFRELLARELYRTGQTVDEPLFEEVAPDGSVRRLNIRPYGLLLTPDLDRAVELLVEVCLASSKLHKGNPDRFLETLELFQGLNDRGELAAAGLTFIFPPALVANFLSQVRDFLGQHEALPVLSHSSVYRQLNRPSYRVVDLAVLRQSSLAFLLTGH